MITTAKNMLFGLFLYWLSFSLLARHVSSLAIAMQSWRPDDGALSIPATPGFIRNTEVDGLGHRIERLASSASQALNTIQQSHDAVVDSNAALTDAFSQRTKSLEQVNAQLQDMADHDGLTGLYNRAYFDRLISQSFEETPTGAAAFSVLLIDVDHFKDFNDFYGHQAGGQALVSLANIFREIQREFACHMARYGGEEFVCLVKQPATNSDEIAQRIHKALATAAIKHEHSAVARSLTVSIGKASTTDDGSLASPDALVSAADDALYEAKFLGRNRTVVSTPDIRRRAQEERQSLQALLSAIKAREFEPFAQPQVDARTGEVLGAEALVRWLQPDGTIVPPGEFMQVAETTGLIKKIDAIMLDKIGDFLSAFPNTLPSLSFNATGESFQDDTYAHRIVELAKSSQTSITVELLETAFIDRPDDQFLWQLDLLREAGVKIEIDDFGTGRTSILGLMSINPSRLKIARELISPLDVREEQKCLVTSVIEIAKTLNMDVLAEGIETKATAQLLIEIGCPIQQGYYHGIPMPLRDFAPHRRQGIAS